MAQIIRQSAVTSLIQPLSSGASQKSQHTRSSMLAQLHAQRIRIPDLGKMMEHWTKEMNPHANTVESKVTSIIENHAINESVRARLTKAKLADQLAGWYPFATCDTMTALTSFQVWMFIIDDLLDQYSLPQRFDYAALQILLADCRDFIQQSLGLSQKCDNDGYEYRDHDAVTSFKEYAGAVMKTFGDNHAYRSRIAREAIATLDGYRHEAMNRHQGRVPSLEEYLAYRAASSCIMQVVVNFEFANNVHMPEEVMKTPEMCRLYESAVAICFILNDIVSLRKEVKEGFVENLVVLLADSDVQRGVDGAAARMQLEVYALDDAAEKATRRFKGTPHEKDIEVLVNNCKNMCRTSWLWSVRTPRYCLADITPDAEGGWVFVVDAMARVHVSTQLNWVAL